jgi:hypothetical protein
MKIFKLLFMGILLSLNAFGQIGSQADCTQAFGGGNSWYRPFCGAGQTGPMRVEGWDTFVGASTGSGPGGGSETMMPGNTPRTCSIYPSLFETLNLAGFSTGQTQLCACVAGAPTCSAIASRACDPLHAAANSGAGAQTPNCFTDGFLNTRVASGGCRCKTDPVCTSGSPCWVPFPTSAPVGSTTCTAPANGSFTTTCTYQAIFNLLNTTVYPPGPNGTCPMITDNITASSCPATKGYNGCGSISVCTSGTCYNLISSGCQYACNPGFTSTFTNGQFTCVASGSPSPSPTGAPAVGPTTPVTPITPTTPVIPVTPTSPTTPTTPVIPCPAGSTGTPPNCTVLISGQIINTVTGLVGCPPNYDLVAIGTNQAECRPTPRSQFYRKHDPGAPAAVRSNNFPVCGEGRIPVNMSYQTFAAATSSVPNPSTSSVPSVSGVFTFLHATGLPQAPVYHYQNFNRCACAFKTPSIGAGLTALNPPLDGDLAEHIENQDLQQTKRYSPVPIAKSETLDGRIGMLHSVGLSPCGCPNLNEVMVDAHPGDANSRGALCRSAVEDGPYRILTPFDRHIHDFKTDSRVMNRDQEQTDVDGEIVSKIRLPRTAGGFAIYSRKIWTCMSPFTLNTSSGKCEFLPSHNGCDSGNGGSIFASEVSNNISGPTAESRFGNTMNKKLACCLNQFGTSGLDFVKFDCVENRIQNYADFNALWRSFDNGAGGQMNALVLTNVQGKRVSGFYTLSGSRCEEFSEFGGPLQRALVNPAQTGAIQGKRATSQSGIDTIGAAYPLPGGADYANVSAASKPVPTSAADKRRCPILVRAAMVATCPDNDTTDPTRPIRVYPSVGTNSNPRQCSAAADISVHVRVEQLYEIAGQPVMKPIDTVIDRAQAGEISIDRIIGNKYGSECPPGQVRDASGSGCRYP